MLKFMDYDVQSLLNLFNNAYLQKMKEPMIIGSEEYTLSSIFSYALAVLVANMNKSELNRFIDTAEGQYLDAIASSFGLSRINNPTENAKIDVHARSASLPLTIELNGMTFSRDYTVADYATYIADAPLMSVSPSKAELTEMLQQIPHTNLEAVSEIYPKGYLADAAGNPIDFPYTKDGDNAFREYIKTHNSITKGTAAYFDQLTKDAHVNIRDIRVIRQSEEHFEPGVVSVLLLTDKTISAREQELITEQILRVLRHPENHSLGQDDFKIYPVTALTGSMRYFKATYDAAFNRNITFAGNTYTLGQLHAKVINEFYTDKVYHIGKPFIDVELINMLSTNISKTTGLSEFILKHYNETILEALNTTKATNVYRVDSYGSSVKNDIVYAPSNTLVLDYSENITVNVTYEALL